LEQNKINLWAYKRDNNKYYTIRYYNKQTVTKALKTQKYN